MEEICLCEYIKGEWLALTAFGESEFEGCAILQSSNIEY